MGTYEDCKAQCKSIPACKYGTYIKNGTRAGQCWLSAQTSIEDRECGVECQSFDKVSFETSAGLATKQGLPASMKTSAAYVNRSLLVLMQSSRTSVRVLALSLAGVISLVALVGVSTTNRRRNEHKLDGNLHEKTHLKSIVPTLNYDESLCV